MLWPGGLVPITIRRGVRQVSLGHEMNGAFHELGGPGQHGQDWTSAQSLECQTFIA